MKAPAPAPQPAPADWASHRCPHCGERFGYMIDGAFHPVAWHGHVIDGVRWIFAPGQKPQMARLRRP